MRASCLVAGANPANAIPYLESKIKGSSQQLPPKYLRVINVLLVFCTIANHHFFDDRFIDRFKTFIFCDNG